MLCSEVTLRENDSGSRAALTEQGLSASQMTAAKVVDVIARLPGQAADAVSAHTQVKMEDAPALLKPPRSERPHKWTHQPRHTSPKSKFNIEEPVVPVERHPLGQPLARLLWEAQFEKVPLGDCPFVHRQQDPYLSV